MIWIARKQDGTLIALSEKEALIHFKPNNISQRMRLEFLGTSGGKTYAEKKAELMKEYTPEYDNAGVIKTESVKEIERLEQEALEAEAVVAKSNGVQAPSRALDVQVAGEGVGNDTLNRARNKLSQAL